MKGRTFTAGLVMAVASLGSTAQEALPARTDAYNACISKIEKVPQEAHEPCARYLERSHSNDPERAEYVKKWMTGYENALPRIEFLRRLTADERAAWVVYDPDTTIDLPQTSDDKGRYKIHIARSFANASEEALLRKAEAVYPGPREMVGELLRSLDGLMDEPAKEMSPIWGSPGNDRVELTSTVTARAVRYYYDLSVTARKEPHLPTGITASSTSLRYDAGIRHFERYSHGKDTFENVYVADLTLKWAFHCGELCGMGFTRNKVVVLDGRGNIVALYLDAPENSESWMS